VPTISALAPPTTALAPAPGIAPVEPTVPISTRAPALPTTPDAQSEGPAPAPPAAWPAASTSPPESTAPAASSAPAAPAAGPVPAASDSRPRLFAVQSRISAERTELDAAVDRAVISKARARLLRVRLARVDARARLAARDGDLSPGAARLLGSQLDRIEGAIPDAGGAGN
jgi:hypothetical protein